MSPKEIRNLSASVLARLLTRARQTGDDYQNLITAFLSERFLYRLGASKIHISPNPAAYQFSLDPYDSSTAA
jgi:hypothetical protein